MAYYRFNVEVKYQHKKWGPQVWKSSLDARSIRRAIALGLKEFFGSNEGRDNSRAAKKMVGVYATRTIRVEKKDSVEMSAPMESIVSKKDPRRKKK